MTRRRRQDIYDKARADALRVWRAVGKRNVIGTAFLAIAGAEEVAPGTLARIVTSLLPGVSVEKATLYVAGAVLFGTRWIDVRKARKAADAEQ
jgi:hypothetical protein